MNARGELASCARHGRPSGPDGGRVPAGERAALAASLGALLRSERLAAGWSTRRLALACGCARSTICRLENGERRPRAGILRLIASVLAVDDPKPLAERLIAAAGDSLRPDTDGWLRLRQRRAVAATLAGHKPLPSDMTRRIELFTAARVARQQAYALLVLPKCTVAQLGKAEQLLATAREAEKRAGRPFTLILGKHRFSFGWDV